MPARHATDWWNGYHRSNNAGVLRTVLLQRAVHSVHVVHVVHSVHSPARRTVWTRPGLFKHLCHVHAGPVSVGARHASPTAMASCAAKASNSGLHYLLSSLSTQSTWSTQSTHGQPQSHTFVASSRLRLLSPHAYNMCLPMPAQPTTLTTSP